MLGVGRVIQVAVLVIALAAPAWAVSWERAIALYNKGDFREALVEFQQIISQQPDAAGAWYYIGLCEFKLKRYRRVELPMSRAISLLEIQSPSSKDIEGAWYAIGFSYYLLGEYDKAIGPLNRYIELASRAGREVNSEARRALGRAYFFLERYDEALSLLSQSPNGRTEWKKDSYYIGAIYFKRGDDDRAIAALKEALEANPEDAAVMDLLAEGLMRKARKSSSAAIWLEAAQVGERLRSVRDDMRTASVLGRAYLGARQFEKAIAPLEKLAKANPEDGQAWFYYGIALSRSGRLRKAMEALEITIRLMPAFIPALAELAYVYESDKQYQQALRVYEKALAVSGSNDPAIKQSIERVRALAAQQQ
jgi:tetratricopeptide (TPR) repeat protein